jgi:hypothetical protein
MDLFVVGTDGFVYTVDWKPEYATNIFSAWSKVEGGRSTPGAPVFAISPYPGYLDL